ncbi:HAMP domain-containing methyl-accepting chemotaxis protein, partial [Oricola cellulosilytica]
MNSIKLKLTVMTRVVIVFAILFATVLGVGFVGYNGMRDLRYSGDEMYEDYFMSVITLNEITKSVNEMYLAQKGHIIAPNEEAMNRFEATMAEEQTGIKPHLDKYEETVDPGAETAAFMSYKEKLKQLFEINNRIIELSRSNNDVEANELSNGEFTRIYSEMRPIIEAMLEANIEGAQKQAAEPVQVFSFASNVMFGILGLAVALVIASWFYLRASVVRPLGAMTRAMNGLTEGDLEIDIPAEGRMDELGDMAGSLVKFRDAAIDKQRMEREADENRNLTEKERAEREAAKAAEAATLNEAIEALAGGLQQLSEGNLTAHIDKPFGEGLDRLRVDFNESVEKLAETLSEVKVNIDTIHSNAGEMRSAVENLSSRTEQQAAALEETSASLEEITSTVKSSSDRAQEATTKAAEAKSASDSSTKVVADAVEAMGRIENASGEIAKIIGVIDEIAFQTNLLALN